MTCNGNAELLTWKIAVLGKTAFGNGTVEAATPLAELVIADQFYTFAFQKAACKLGQETVLAAAIGKQRSREAKVPMTRCMAWSLCPESESAGQT